MSVSPGIAECFWQPFHPLEFLLGGSWVPESFNLYRRASSRIPKYLACSFRQRRLDSATALAIARHEGFSVHALSFDYGQRHRFELESARRVAASQHVLRHVILSIDLRTFGGSSNYNSLQATVNRRFSRSVSLVMMPRNFFACFIDEVSLAYAGSEPLAWTKRFCCSLTGNGRIRFWIG